MRSAEKTRETRAHARVLAFQFHSPTDTNASIPHTLGRYEWVSYFNSSEEKDNWLQYKKQRFKAAVAEAKR